METRERIMDSALTLMQTRGFNAFSYRDVADEVGVRSASIHHYFPTKEDLGKEVIRLYKSRVAEALDGIARTNPDPVRKIEKFIALLGKSAEDGESVCLCGMLMSDCLTLEKGMQQELILLVTEFELWLAGVLAEGRELAVFHFKEQPAFLARALFASFQGILMCARAHKEPARFGRAAQSLTALLKR